MAEPITGTYGVVHRVSSGGAIGEYRAMNGTVAITMQNADNSEVVREWLTDEEARAHVDRLAGILGKTDRSGAEILAEVVREALAAADANARGKTGAQRDAVFAEAAHIISGTLGYLDSSAEHHPQDDGR